MGAHLADLTTLSVASGGTTSNSAIDCGDAKSITIFAPSAVSGTITLQISPDDSSWHDLTSGGTDVTVAAGNSVTMTDVAWHAIRVTSGGTAQTGARTFLIQKSFPV